MSERHPSELALEQHLAGRGDAAAHVAGCPSCQARLEQMRGEGEEFARFVFPRTLEAVEKRPARGALWRWLWAAPVALAAAAALVIVRPGAPADDYAGTKGGTLALTVFLGGPSGARQLGDGDDVPAGGALRFRVQAAHACRLWLVSVDAAGGISRLYPTDAAAGASVQGLQAIPGGAVLDGKPGPERFFAVCSAGELPFARVEASARGAAADLRASRALAGLPEGTAQASVLLVKTP